LGAALAAVLALTAVVALLAAVLRLLTAAALLVTEDAALEAAPVVGTAAAVSVLEALANALALVLASDPVLLPPQAARRALPKPPPPIPLSICLRVTRPGLMPDSFLSLRYAALPTAP